MKNKKTSEKKTLCVRRIQIWKKKIKYKIKYEFKHIYWKKKQQVVNLIKFQSRNLFPSFSMSITNSFICANAKKKYILILTFTILCR